MASILDQTEYVFKLVRIYKIQTVISDMVYLLKICFNEVNTCEIIITLNINNKM